MILPLKFVFREIHIHPAIRISFSGHPIKTSTSLTACIFSCPLSHIAYLEFVTSSPFARHLIKASTLNYLDGLIDEGLFRQKLEDYKKRQIELRDQLARHETADLEFHVTANQVMLLAKRAWDIFESSEVEEKRQLLNFVFQNLKLDGKTCL